MRPLRLGDAQANSLMQSAALTALNYNPTGIPFGTIISAALKIFGSGKSAEFPSYWVRINITPEQSPYIVDEPYPGRGNSSYINSALNAFLGQARNVLLAATLPGKNPRWVISAVFANEEYGWFADVTIDVQGIAYPIFNVARVDQANALIVLQRGIAGGVKSILLGAQTSLFAPDGVKAARSADPGTFTTTVQFSAWYSSIVAAAKAQKSSIPIEENPMKLSGDFGMSGLNVINYDAGSLADNMKAAKLVTDIANQWLLFLKRYPKTPNTAAGFNNWLGRNYAGTLPATMDEVGAWYNELGYLYSNDPAWTGNAAWVPKITAIILARAKEMGVGIERVVDVQVVDSEAARIKAEQDAIAAAKKKAADDQIKANAEAAAEIARLQAESANQAIRDAANAEIKRIQAENDARIAAQRLKDAQDEAARIIANAKTAAEVATAKAELERLQKELQIALNNVNTARTDEIAANDIDYIVVNARGERFDTAVRDATGRVIGIRQPTTEWISRMPNMSTFVNPGVTQFSPDWQTPPYQQYPYPYPQSDSGISEADMMKYGMIAFAGLAAIMLLSKR